MAQNINRVVITGNLTRDPELSHTPGGTAVCRMGVAVNGRKKEGDNWVDKPNFFDVVAWGNLGERCAQYLSKGRPVAVDGRLEWSSWEAKDGSGKRSKVEIVADNVQFLGSRGDGDGGGSSSGSSSGSAPAGDDADFGGDADFAAPAGDDDIPF